MTRFAFIVHPLTPRDAAAKYPIARYVPESILKAFLKRKSPVVMSKASVESASGATTEGWFIACPLTPDMMIRELPLEVVYDRIVACTKLAKELGADLVGLGAFTSVVGDGGITIAKRSPLPVTTGNSYTVATAIEGTLRAAELVGVDLAQATLAVVGATGSIGKTCARILGKRFGRTLIIGRDLAKTQAVAAEIGLGEPVIDLNRLIEADVVITVTSSDSEIIMPENLKPGAIVCDVARPRDVSARVGSERPDVLVIEGGVVSVPGSPDFGFNFRFPKGTAYACMSETIMLALEGRAESFTLGKDVSEEQVETTWELAKKHGFTLSQFRAFEKVVDDSAIARAREARAIGHQALVSASG